VDQHFTLTKVGAQAIGRTTALRMAHGNQRRGRRHSEQRHARRFHFLNTTVTGDVTITARLVSVQTEWIQLTPYVIRYYAGCGFDSRILRREQPAADAGFIAPLQGRTARMRRPRRGCPFQSG
jgi:hypothetical protein